MSFSHDYKTTNMKVLIVGANGFLGRHLVEKCLAYRWKVSVVYSKNRNNLPANCEQIHIDNIDNLDDNYEMIFLSTGNFSLSYHDLIKANVETILILLKKFRKSKIIFISSVSVYGDQKKIINEETCFNNPTIYGLSKIAGEFVTASFRRYAIIRLSYLYGKDMMPKSFLPIILRDAKRNRKIILTNQGKRLQDYLHVDDAATICLKAALHNKNGIFLGATGKSYSNLKVAQVISNDIERCEIVFSQLNKYSPSYVINNKKTKDALNWSPEHLLINDLHELIKNENCNF